jgi:DNA-binding HxlR family transcriptional regulator
MVNRHFVATETGDETVAEIANVWEVLGRRWSLLILKNFCTNEVIRFNEFKKLLPGISRWKVPRITTKTKSRAGARSAG